jgi:cell division protein FtsL
MLLDQIFWTVIILTALFFTYVTHLKRQGFIERNNKLYIKETSYYNLGKKYIKYVKLIKNKKHEKDESIILDLALDINEDVKILLEMEENE